MNVAIWIIFATVIITTYSKEFPYRRFFSFGTVEKSEEQIRKGEFLCTVGKSWITRCSCEKDCMKYRTCCIDYLWNISSTISLASYIRQFISESRKYKQLKCTPIIAGLNEKKVHTIESLLMVSKCPRGVGREMRHKCKQNKLGLSLLPVIGSDKYIYKNKYCAKCNRVEQFEYLKVKAECEDKILKNNSSKTRKGKLDEYSGCTIDIVEDSEQMKIARYCKANVVSKCAKIPDDGPKNIDCRICKHYNAGVTSPSGRCCKNPHCCRDEFLRSQNQTDQPDICSDAFPATARGTFPLTRFISALPTYTILLTFKDSKDFKGAARDDLADIACPDGYTIVGSECQLDKPQDLISKVDTSEDDFERNCLGKYVYVVVKADEDIRKDELKNLEEAGPKTDNDVVYVNQTHSIVKVLEANVSDFISLIPKGIDYELVKTSVPKVYHNKMYGMDFTRSFKGPRICVSPVIHDRSKFNISSNCFVTLNENILYVNEYVLLSRIKSTVRQFLVTCQKFHQFKPCLLRTIKNYTILPNNSIQTLSNNTYKPDEYQPTKNGIGICITKRKATKLWLEVVQAVEGYLTVIGCSLSIVAYLWTILTYSLIAELRTTPGKNIICLCSMLLACDALMLLSKISAWCKYIAILLHFFALSAQFWSVITAFDIWATFQGKSLSRNMKSNKRFLCYCLWGWLSPLCFIMLCITLDMTRVAEVGYGKYGVCWITSLPARLVTYIIPVAVSIVFTVTVLTYTLYRIFRQCNKSKTLLKKRGGNNVSLAVMALKLVILLGVIEIVGFLQFTGNNTINWIFTSIFQLIYVIIRSFRGVFVWLLYVVTDRVFKIYRNLREQRSYMSTTTKLTPVRRTVPRNMRSFSTRSSENFNTTLTIAPTPTPL